MQSFSNVSVPTKMSGARSRSLSVGHLPSRGSSEFFSNGGYETFKSKVVDMTEAMLTEIEDIIREYDTDIGSLFFKSQPSTQNSTEKVVSEEFKEAPSLGSQGQARSARSWGHRGSLLWTQHSMDSQSVVGEAQTDRDNLNALTRSIYMLLSTELAPKLQALMKEVGQLRRHNELLSDKVEQQRQRNDKQLEEFEELQCELRAKERQLREQRLATKSLDICQGENAMLKMELKNLRGRMEKLAERKAKPIETRAVQETPEIHWRRNSSNESNEWLVKENAELQREVTRWKTENTEKDVVISELKGVIKNMTVVETPRGSVQRRVSTAHFRPDSLTAPAPSRQGADLTLETPRGRFRSIVLDNLGQMACTQNTATTLAEDLGMTSAKSTDPSNGQPLANPSERRNIGKRGSLVPPLPSLAAARVDNAGNRSRFSSSGDSFTADINLEQRLREASEAMESACCEVEDYRVSWGRKAFELESNIANLKRALLQAEERLLAAAAEVEGLRNQRLTAMAEHRETQRQLKDATKQLRRNAHQIESLQDALEKMNRALADVHTEPDHDTQALESVEEQKPTLEKSNEVPEAVLLSSSGTIGTQQTRSAEPLDGPPVEAARMAAPGPSPRYPRGEKIKVVLRNHKPKDCCSPLALFTLWKTGTPGPNTPRLYSLEAPGDVKSGMWTSRKPRIALQAATNAGK